MVHKGPVFRSKCIGTVRAQTQLLINQSIKWAHKNVKMYFFIPSTPHIIYPRSFITYIPPLHPFCSYLILHLFRPSIFSLLILIPHLCLICILLFLVLSLFASLSVPFYSHWLKPLDRLHVVLCSKITKVSACASQHKQTKLHHNRTALLILHEYLHLIRPAIVWRTTQSNSSKQLQIIKTINSKGLVKLLSFVLKLYLVSHNLGRTDMSGEIVNKTKIMKFL
jgi:hypothetical protein